MNREDLFKHAEVAMCVAKTNLIEKGKVLPALVMIPSNNQSRIMTPAVDKVNLHSSAETESARKSVVDLKKTSQ